MGVPETESSAAWWNGVGLMPAAEDGVNDDDDRPNLRLVYTAAADGDDEAAAPLPCRAFLVATTDISAMDELTWDYGPAYDRHWLPQWLYVKDSCDHVLRFENLESDFEKLMKRFAGTVSPATEIPGYALAREPLEQRPACDVLGAEDLDDQSIALLATIYAEDFRQLKYDLPSTPAAMTSMASAVTPALALNSMSMAPKPDSSVGVPTDSSPPP